MSETKLRIGYIPLVDAAVLIVAVDRKFAAAEGLSIELVREVSWSNVRDKLNIGLFDAAHLLSPVAIASSLGIGHVRVPIIAPFNLGINGNAITVSPRLYAALAEAADGELSDPKASARALAHVVADRKTRGADPLTFPTPSGHRAPADAMLPGHPRRPAGRAPRRLADGSGVLPRTLCHSL